jgi:nitroreductase
MNFSDLVKKRQSDRAYLDKLVDRATIDRCIEAARLAPSACNSQPWTFIVIDNPDIRKNIAAKLHDIVMKGNKFVESAPVLVAIVEEKPNITSRIGGLLKEKQFTFLDIGMAVENFCLQAAQEGLGTCMLGWFDEKGVRKLLKIPKDRRIPIVISLGYPVSDETRPKVRKPLETMRFFNGWGQSHP